MSIINQQTLIEAINWIWDNDEVPMIHGSPGEGKSSIVQSLADGRETLLAHYTNGVEKLKLITMACSNHPVEDFVGIPYKNNNDKAEYMPFINLPVDTDPLPAGYDGWILFLDEISAAKPLVQVALQMLILDRKVGNANLHPNVRIVCAGNRKEDRAGANELGTALRSRMIHFNYLSDPDQWLQYAFNNDFDPRILSFISYNKDNIRNFDPDSDDHTFACPRTWEKLSNLIKPYQDLNAIDALIEGTIGARMTVQFQVFAKHFMDLPSIADIVADPVTCMIPTEKVKQFACIYNCLHNTDVNNISAIIKYVLRFSSEFVTIYGRNLNKKDPTMITKSKDFSNMVMYTISGL
jgi:hypothetical protein